MELNDGSKVERIVELPKGEPENPASWDDVKTKAWKIDDYCLKDYVSDNEYSEIIDRGQVLEKEQSIGNYIREPPRVPWRLHQYERGWSPWDDSEGIQSSSGRGRCASFTSGVMPATGLMVA